MRGFHISFVIGYTPYFMQYGDDYYYDGAYCLMCYFAGEAISTWFINPFAQKHLGCQGSMIIGSLFMFLQVLPLNFLNQPISNSGLNAAVAFMYVTAFLGGIGYLLSWDGLIQYNLLTYKSKSLKQSDSWKYLMHLENLSLVVVMPITAVVGAPDFQAFQLLHTSVAFASFIMIMTLSRPVSKENKK
eukprot:403339343